MKYIAIDIETTGLDPRYDQVLELALVADDLEVQAPVSELPVLHRYIVHPRISGDPVALAMNVKTLFLLGEHAKKTGVHDPRLFVDSGSQLRSTVSAWLDALGWGNKFNAAGKNFSSFDRMFLLPLFASEGNTLRVNHCSFRHRALDPSILYAKRDDEVLPSLTECLSRAGLGEPTNLHSAVGDAIDVIRLIRAKFPLLT